MGRLSSCGISQQFGTGSGIMGIGVKKRKGEWGKERTVQILNLGSEGQAARKGTEDYLRGNKIYG